MENFIIINNVFRHDLKQHIKDFNENHLLVLTYMQKFKTYSGEMNFTMGWLFDDLKITYYNLQQVLINCFDDLVKWGLITLLDNVDKINKNTRLKVELPVYDNKFTQIALDEINKILNLNEDIRIKKVMLFLYCDIASWIDSKGYCYTPYYYFKQDLGGVKNDNRINDALRKLKTNNLIDYSNIGEVEINGQVTQGNNVYVLCCQEDYKDILQRGLENRKQQYEEGKAYIYKTIQSNKKRKYANLINHRRIKYYNDTITEVELKELKKYEKEYYNLIKNNKDVLSKKKNEFITIDIDNENKEEALIDLFL